MAKTEKLYFGKSGGYWAFVAVIAIGFLSYTGYIDLSSLGSDDTATIIDANIDLDSTFLSVVSANYSLADTDTNYDEDSGVITIPIDVDVSDDGSDTTFTMKSKAINGTTVTLMSFTNSGVLDEPSDDESIEFVMTVKEAFDGGITSTDEIAYASVLVSAPGLVDDDKDDYYPIVCRSGDSDNPAVYVDGELDEETYTWQSTTDDREIEISFNVSAEGIVKMEDLSSITVKSTFEGADQGDLDIKFIKISAL
nr:hypothetical protein [uncultured Methanolobus sp.]